MALHDPPLRVVLYEGSGAESVDAESRWAAMNALLERGFAVTRAGAERPVSPADTTPMLVVARWQQPPPDSADAKVRWGSLDPATVAEQAEAARAEFSSPTPGAWRPWFPVIDYDRCTNCMQCLSFCLFGVYGVDSGKRIQVQNNDNCKTNCPACSRVCPEAAIMFPKYKAGPINGDVVSDSDLNREKMKIDISSLLGGDVYSLLRDRSERARSRFGKERDSDKALAERQKCLNKLASLAADIPAEVLMSLPSPDEIARKAAEASAKAQAALAEQSPRTSPTN
ncbi:MAG: ferredoxin family protein [Verrucomicrobiota bacterium]